MRESDGSSPVNADVIRDVESLNFFTSLPGRGKILRNLAFVAAMSVLAGIGSGYTPPLNPNSYYETDPRNEFFDTYAWPALRVVMIAKADGKVTHDPHWVETTINPKFQGVKMEGDPGLMHRENFFQGKWFELHKINLSKVQISLGGWWQKFGLKPKIPVSSWHLKFQGMEKSGRGQILRLKLDEDGVQVLRGDKDYMAYGEDEDGNEVLLDKTDPVPRWQPLSGPLS